MLTTLAFVTVRVRERLEDDFGLLGPYVLVATVGALTLFSVLGTIFGERTLADAAVLKKILLPAVYNTLLAPLILAMAPRTLGVARRRSASLSL